MSGINFVGVAGEVSDVFTGKFLGQITFSWDYQKAWPGLAPVVRTSFENVERATSPVASLSVRFMPWILETGRRAALP